MERHGFEIITPGDMSVEEQIAAFRNAEIIVGPHGAGLANLVYCRSGGGTRVIELAQMSYVAGFFVRICQAKQLDYTGLVNPNVATPKEANQPADRHNINDISSMIDIKLLESVIEKL
jgi:capsular polysaccharide biosynthesis protein